MYNFKDNILKLSKTQDLDELKNEWVIVNDKPHVKNVVCVCRKDIAYFHIFHNKKTSEFSIVGTTCKKKLLPNTSLNKLNIIQCFNGIHDYTMIPDIYEYSREVINIFLDELRNESFKIILSFKYMLIAFSTD